MPNLACKEKCLGRNVMSNFPIRGVNRFLVNQFLDALKLNCDSDGFSPARSSAYVRDFGGRNASPANRLSSFNLPNSSLASIYRSELHGLVLIR